MTSRQFVPMDPVEPRMTTRRRKSDLEALAWDAGTHHPEKSQGGDWDYTRMPRILMAPGKWLL